MEWEGEEIKELPPRLIEFPFYLNFQISSVSYNYGNLTFIYIYIYIYIYNYEVILIFLKHSEYTWYFFQKHPIYTYMYI